MSLAIHYRLLMSGYPPHLENYLLHEEEDGCRMGEQGDGGDAAGSNLG